MSKESTMQIRMDTQIKEEAEALYKSLGTSFAEAVRVFAVQSIMEHGYPFTPRVYNVPVQSARGILSAHASDSLRQQEQGAFRKAMVAKHG